MAAAPSESIFGGIERQPERGQRRQPSQRQIKEIEEHTVDESDEIFRVVTTNNPPIPYARTRLLWESITARLYCDESVLPDHLAGRLFNIPDSTKQRARDRQQQPLSLGKLSTLCPELIHWILEHLDIESIIRFRQVNSLAKSFVEHSHDYRTIIREAPLAFLTLIKAPKLDYTPRRYTSLASRYTISDLMTVLCRDRCDACTTEYGAFLFLSNIRLQRLCFACLVRKRRDLLYKAEFEHVFLEFRGNLVLPHDEWERVSLLPPPPESGNRITMPMPWIPHNTAWISLEPYQPQHTRYVSSGRAAVRIPHLVGRTKTPEEPRSCRGCIAAAERLIREGSSGLGLVQPGGGGQRLQDHPTVKLAGKPLSKAMFFEHFENCPDAKLIWSEAQLAKIAL